ncbi:GNAT family N-acetyltransferase [Phycicoccus flavus]|uniref:GNAT family N-acetyltransferase n=1 Tax=Phycicoccus flavus TaxID=2502783 RepID=UPI00197B3C9B|nr:GNAT family protein [Phycicoccus flavus]
MCGCDRGRPRTRPPSSRPRATPTSRSSPPSRPTPTPEAVAAYLARQHGRTAQGQGYSFAVADRASDEAVGGIGLWTGEIDTGRASTGYWVAPPVRGRGYVTDALRTLVGWASGLPEVERLQLFVEPWNEASARAAVAAGFEREGLLRSWQRVGGSRRDMVVYGLLPRR